MRTLDRVVAHAAKRVNNHRVVLWPILALLCFCQGCGIAFPTGTDHNRPLINGALSRSGVHTLTGSFSTDFTTETMDADIDGRGPTPLLLRTYNSNDTRVTTLGPGWRHNHATRLMPGGCPGQFVLVGPQGRSDQYTTKNDGSGNYFPPGGVSTALHIDTSSGSAVYTATLSDQSTWTFNAAGVLTAIGDRYGNTSTLVNDSTGSAGRPTSISDPAGRGSLSLTYDTCYVGRLCTVSDWTGHSVSYTYFPSTHHIAMGCCVR